MARLPRIILPDAYYHVMARSLTEFKLFRDDSDKQAYLDMLALVVKSFDASVVAFCLMDTHLHFIMNPNQGNLSNMMKMVHGMYAKYYNKKYNRRGPVFADRFKSKIIDSVRYLLTATCYVHYNALDLGYGPDQIQNYPFSSFKIYAKGNTGTSFPIDLSFVLSHLGDSIDSFLSLHLDYLRKNPNIDTPTGWEFTKESHLYVTGKHYLYQKLAPSKLLYKLSQYFDLNLTHLFSKSYQRNYHAVKALTALLLYRICGLSGREIASILGNLSLSNIYRLSREGQLLLEKHISEHDLMAYIFSS